MKRYLVFGFSTGKGAGGAHDIIGDVDTLAETYDIIGRQYPTLETHTLDTETGDIIESSPRCAVHSVAALRDRPSGGETLDGPPSPPFRDAEAVEAMRLPPGWKVEHIPHR